MLRSSASPPTSARPRVVVVGGSFAGLAAARHLRNSCDVVVVEPRDYFEYAPGALHLMSGSESFSSLLSPMSEVARGCKHERGWVVGFKPESRRALVRRQASEEKEEETLEIEFDALVLCSGRRCSLRFHLRQQKPVYEAASPQPESNDLHGAEIV